MVSVNKVTNDSRQTNKEMEQQLNNVGQMIEEVVTMLNTTDDELTKAIYKVKLKTINSMCMTLGIGYDYEFDKETEETTVIMTKTKAWA